MIPYAAWEPDRYQVGTGVSGDANGVLPAPDGYGPFPDLETISLAIGDTCRGAISLLDSTGSTVIFAFTATKAYKYVGPTDAWTDVTRSSGGNYSCPDDTLWGLERFGNNLIAVNQNDAPQTIDIDSGTHFAALGGSPPNAGVVKAFGDVLMLGNLTDNPNRLAWSARNASDFWTYGQRDCDYNDFADGAIVRGITNQQAGLVFLDRGIVRIAPTNGPEIFSIAVLSSEIGLLSADSLVTIGGVSFFYSDAGFMQASVAGGLKAIGANRVDAWFLADVNGNRRYAVRGVRDPNRNRIFWLYPSGSNDTELFDKVIIYDVPTDRWSYASVTASVLIAATSPGYTTDTIDDLLTALGIDSEDDTFSLDQRWLAGGQPFLAAFDADNKLASFTGSPIAATIETMDFQATPGGRSLITAVWPNDDATGGTVAVGARERVQGSVTFGSAVSQNSDGKCSVRSGGRYHRVRRTITAGVSWTKAVGVEIDFVPDGQQ